MATREHIEMLLDGLCVPLHFGYQVCPVGDEREEQALAAVADEYLVGSELVQLASLRSGKRRAEFRAGRIAAKRLLARPPFNLDPRSVEVVRLPSGAPQVLIPGCCRAIDTELYLTISHCAEFAIAVGAPIPVGVDLERDEHRPEAFIRTFLSLEEQAIANALSSELRDRAVNVLWSRKEAVSKVYHWGSRLVFRDLNCSRMPVRLQRRTIDCRSNEGFGFVASVAYAET